MNKVKKRIFYFDELRALAILFVILCHSTTIYKPFYYNLSYLSIPSIMNILGWVGVPIFFMLSGALLFNRDYTLGDFFKKRFTRILIPFIFWMIITVIFDYFVLGYSTKTLINLVLGKKRYTWFVWVMIGIYLITPVINSFIKEYGQRGVEYFLLIWGFVMVLNTFDKYPLFNLELSYFAGCLGFSVLGYYLANKDFRLSDKALIILGPILYFVCLAIDWYIHGLGLFPNASAYYSVYVILASCGLFLFFKAINNYSSEHKESFISRIHNKIEYGFLGKVILSISVCSYGMYFMNSLVIGLLKSWNLNTLKMMPVIFIIAVLVSWLVIVALDKIPQLRKFIGT